jgi:shikimate dehydrogenase
MAAVFLGLGVACFLLMRMTIPKLFFGTGKIARSAEMFASGWDEIRRTPRTSLLVVLIDIVKYLLTAWRFLLVFQLLGYDNSFWFYLVIAPAAAIAGACNAVRLGPQGQLQGDMFDGEGFVRGVLRKGFKLQGARVLVVGAGGVGSAIAASLAAAGVAAISLFDMNPAAAEALAGRLRAHYPALEVATGSNDPAGHALVVNATPMGMNEGDPLPMDVSRIAPGTFVGEVVMRTEMTAFLNAARVRGCPVQVGSDMLFEQIPAYLEFFNLPTTTPDVLRAVARLQY